MNLSILASATQLAAAHVAAGNLLPEGTATFVQSFVRNLEQLAHPEHPEDSANDNALERPEPAVPIEQSVAHDHLVCLEDGKKMIMLKRYLRTHHQMSPEEYRRKWNLPSDYPMIAPSYKAKKRAQARAVRLGHYKRK